MSPSPPIAPASLVPASLRLGALVVVPAAFVCAFVVALIVGGIYVRKVPRTPWTERARASYPGRIGMAVVALVAALCAGLCAGWLAPAIPGAWSPIVVGVATGLAAYLGADVVRLAVERRAHGPVSARGWFAWKPIVFFLYAVQLVPVGIGAFVIGDRFDAHAWTVLAVVAAVAIALQSGLAWLVLWWIGVVRPSSTRLRAAVDRASLRTGVEPRAVGILPTFGVPFANAFALPLLRRIAFTSEALAILDDEEIEAVAAHELGHVGEPRIVAVARLGRAAIFLPVVVVRPIVGAVGWVGIVLALVALFGFARLSVMLTRRMEERADAIGRGANAHVEGPIYARALEKLYVRNLVPAVMRGKRRAHPDLWDRMVEAGATPSYAKPKPPRMRGPLLVAFLLVYGAFVAFGGFLGWVKWTVESGASASIAKEARARMENGDPENAYELYLSAIEIADHPALHVGIAWAEATLDVCDEAADDLHIATTRKKRDPELDDASLAVATNAVGQCYARREAATQSDESPPVDPPFVQDQLPVPAPTP